MKKSIIAICGAALSLAAFAEPEAPEAAPEAPAAVRPARPARPERAPRQKPTFLQIDDKTTIEQIAAFKEEVSKKVDEAVAAYAAKDGDKKRPARIVLFVNDGSFGGPQGMGRGGEGRGPRGPQGGMRGQGRGDRGPRGPRGPRGGAPEAAPEAPAPDAK